MRTINTLFATALLLPTLGLGFISYAENKPALEKTECQKADCCNKKDCKDGKCTTKGHCKYEKGQKDCNCDHEKSA